MECVGFNYQDGAHAGDFEPKAVITQETGMADLVPSEAASGRFVDPTVGTSFPKVLRLRLDKFFADQKICPKADTVMWSKIAIGLAALTSCWIALYLFRPGPLTFVALYLLGGLAQTFLLLNIAHDSNH